MKSVNSKPLLQIAANNFEIAYGELLALRCPNLKAEGGIIAIVGHNGAGKSTLIKGVLGLLPIRRGNITATLWQNNSPQQLYPESHMAFCPETGAVFGDITVESYLRLWCRIKRSDGDFYRNQGGHYLELLEILPLLGRLGRELSKGQRRRVQTAIGFISGARLFLFDEPFDGLDVQKTSALANIISAEAHHMTFVISSHRMDVVERIADVVLVLHEGKIAAQGDPAAVAKILCGHSVAITSPDPQKVAETVAAQLPDAVITRLGNRVTVSGKTASPDVLQRCARKAGVSARQEPPIEPSLVDAMNYLLKNRPAGGSTLCSSSSNVL